MMTKGAEESLLLAPILDDGQLLLILTLRILSTLEFTITPSYIGLKENGMLSSQNLSCSINNNRLIFLIYQGVSVDTTT